MAQPAGVGEEKAGVEEMMHDPIGALGPFAGCPVCGAFDVDWDPETDITTCKRCGFRNEEQARRNYEKRKRNGEV